MEATGQLDRSAEDATLEQLLATTGSAPPAPQQRVTLQDSDQRDQCLFYLGGHANGSSTQQTGTQLTAASKALKISYHQPQNCQSDYGPFQGGVLQ